MKILALEFSTSVRAVAVGGDVRARGYAEESGGRETKPLALIQRALKEAGVAREEIDCIAVGLGPGSYAGVRTAIAIAQGWQLARNVKILGISSAEVVAAHAGQLGAPESVLVGAEAHGGNLYVARYDASVVERPVLVEAFHPVTEAERAQKIFRMDWPRGFESPEGMAFPPEADFLALLAMHRTDFCPGGALEPIYLRPTEFVKAPLPKFSAL